HQGIDLAGALNSPVLSAHDGIIVYAGRGFKGYGKMILVEYNHMWATLYAHLNRYKIKTGEWVTRGQLIGLMGRTGRVSGVHLHFELLKDKQPVDPLSMLRFKGEVALNSEVILQQSLASIRRFLPNAECNQEGWEIHPFLCDKLYEKAGSP
ncbi:MAG: M23 family metallopeptidase, partial [Bdellovibrionales bacterium]|nr:M23 family metallopeptidase [Bdellovibrionales bacterium]